jgi:uncharacterized repeat protein (TIGR03803 family)
MTRIPGISGKCIVAGALALAVVVPPGSACAKNGETVLHAFTEKGDGGFPNAGLLADEQGNLYGTTEGGGSSTNCESGCGTVFKLAPDGTEAVLYSFCPAAQCGDGDQPYAGLIEDRAANLYGTTYLGGAHNFGTVFRLAPDGTESVLYSFGANSGDGAYPLAGLSEDRAGNLYGTTSGGGHYDRCKQIGIGCGTVFRLAPDGTETVLYRFTGGRDGANPYAGLIMDKGGNLYGTTLFGGAGDSGTVFRLAPDGTKTVLSHFRNGIDFDSPHADLIEDKAGNLYGTTFLGGGYGLGTVFKITSKGRAMALHTFTGTDGKYPESRLVMDEAGNLYGTTSEGGADNLGTIFRLAPDGTESVLHSFCSRSNCTDGATPAAGLTKDKAGNLYGTTLDGGDPGCDSGEGCGTVFRLNKQL